MKIVIAGGSGQVGRILVRAFGADQHHVVVLSRTPAQLAMARMIAWDGRTLGEWAAEIDGADVLINLAGRSVDCRYNAANRRRILNSRVDSTRVLGEAIARAARPPRVWLNASTATIYRHALDRPMGEADGELGGNEPGVPETWRFSIEVAKAWERAFFEAQTPCTRKVAMRSAMTMSRDAGGVFDVLLRLVRFGLGGAQGDGRQFVSWIHERDFVRAVLLLIAREDMEGAVNLASPNPLPNCEFMAAIRDACKMPIGLPAARWMVEVGAALLRTESELVLKSRRVVPQRLLETGFEFEFPEWTAAAKDLCGQLRR